jgi:hypothetical protein
MREWKETVQMAITTMNTVMGKEYGKGEEI